MVMAIEETANGEDYGSTGVDIPRFKDNGWVL
jgi:hypothetical protein